MWWTKKEITQSITQEKVCTVDNMARKEEQANQCSVLWHKNNAMCTGRLSLDHRSAHAQQRLFMISIYLTFGDINTISASLENFHTDTMTTAIFCWCFF